MRAHAADIHLIGHHPKLVAARAVPLGSTPATAKHFFSPDARRVGVGGGYLHLTLAGVGQSGGVRAVVVAYAAQEVAEVLRDGGDQPFDWIVTEDESIRVRADPS